MRIFIIKQCLLSYSFQHQSLQPAQSMCIVYDYGQNHKYHVSTPTFLCQNGQQFQQTISFSQEFCAPPKILIQGVLYFRQDYASFSFKILIVTTTEFQVLMQCNSQFPLIYYTFEWVALIDNKIFIFNDFMQSITLIDGYRTRVIPYPMQNIDYEVSFNIISYSGGSPNIVIEKQATGFNLYVSGVDNIQLSGLGVQIIAGSNSQYTFFDSMSIQQCNNFHNFPKIPSGFTFLPNQIRIIALQNFYDEITGISSQFYIDRYVVFRDQLCHPEFPVNFKLYIYDFKYLPHYYKKIRVVNMMCLDYILMGSFDTQKLYFKEIDQTWIDSYFIIPSFEYSQVSIQLVYYHSCQPRRKITVTILREGKQGEYNYTYSLYCHISYNLITMHISLFQVRFGLSELQFGLTDQGVSIQEKITNNGDTYQLLSIKY